LQAFDFESTQDTPTELKEIFEHCVNFVSVKWTCTDCLGKINIDCEYCNEIGEVKLKKKSRRKRIIEEEENDEDTHEQGNEGIRSRSWSELEGCENPLRSFVQWLVTAFSNNVPTIAYAHAGGHYV